MSGNTTRLGIEFAGLNGGIATAARSGLSFGVICGSLAGHFGGAAQIGRARVVALALAAAASTGSASLPAPPLVRHGRRERRLPARRRGHHRAHLHDRDAGQDGPALAGACRRPTLAWVRHFVLWIGLLTGCINGASRITSSAKAVWLAALAAPFASLPFLPLTIERAGRLPARESVISRPARSPPCAPLPCHRPLAFALAACQTAAAAPPAPPPEQAAAGVTPNTFRMPTGSGCSGEVERFQAVMDNDLATGHTTKGVHTQVSAEIATRAPELRRRQRGRRDRARSGRRRRASAIPER